MIPGSVRFTRALFLEICEELSEGATLVEICARPDRPSRKTFYKWLYRDTDTGAWCREAYAAARAMRYDGMIDELLIIADTQPEDRTDAESLKLRVATRQWVISKVGPKMYRDGRQEITVRGPDGDSATPDLGPVSETVAWLANEIARATDPSPADTGEE